jgi:hypothetical protein
MSRSSQDRRYENIVQPVNLFGDDADDNNNHNNNRQTNRNSIYSTESAEEMMITTGFHNSKVSSPSSPTVTETASAISTNNSSEQVAVMEEETRLPAQEETAEERARREEQESLELARLLQGEEAMAVYERGYNNQLELLRQSQGDFSAEDLAALQAAMEEDRQDADQDDDDDDSPAGPDNYELLLRLGEQIGDVAKERWAQIAQQKIDALPVVKFQSDCVKSNCNECDVKCLVCYEQYEDGEMLRKLLPCDHCFHKDCIDQWLREKDFCPYCRTSLNDNKDDA